MEATPFHDPQRAVAEELCHVHDLVRLRALLHELGATPDEVAGYDATVAAARERLAASARAAALANAA